LSDCLLGSGWNVVSVVNHKSQRHLWHCFLTCHFYHCFHTAASVRRTKLPCLLMAHLNLSFLRDFSMATSLNEKKRRMQNASPMLMV
jgi:hypothetical protein